VPLVPVIAGIAGALLIWCALKNKHPLDVIQRALQGGDIMGSRPLAIMPADTPPGPGLTDPGQPLEEYRDYDPNAPGLGGMPTI
jgi:hypothetical protein